MLLEYQILHNIHKVHDDILQKTVLLLCELLNMSILRASVCRNSRWMYKKVDTKVLLNSSSS